MLKPGRQFWWRYSLILIYFSYFSYFGYSVTWTVKELTRFIFIIDFKIIIKLFNYCSQFLGSRPIFKHAIRWQKIRTFLVRFGEFGMSCTGQLHRVRPPPAQYWIIVRWSISRDRWCVWVLLHKSVRIVILRSSGGRTLNLHPPHF